MIDPNEIRKAQHAFQRDEANQALATLTKIVDECAELRRLAYDQAATLSVLRHEHNTLRAMLQQISTYPHVGAAMREHIQQTLARIKP